MIYGYARVSTIAQSRDGNSLEEQTAALTEYGCQEIITEAYTGKTVERPRFAELLSRLQSGDTLVVTKLDRFARSTIEGVQTVRELFARDVKVHILNIGLIENTLTGNLILTVSLVLEMQIKNQVRLRLFLPKWKINHHKKKFGGLRITRK